MTSTEKVLDCDEEDGSIQEGHCSSTIDGMYCQQVTVDLLQFASTVCKEM